MEDLEGKSGIFMVRNKVIPAGSTAHIIQRAPGKEPLFLEESDYLYFLKLLKEFSSKHNVEVFCFVLMSNHFHLLVKFLRENASTAIKNLCERYAWFFNRKYKRKGHVFYGAFRVSLCLEDSYLLTSSLYIHINPVKAGLSSLPSLYSWSSCSLYTKNISPTTFIKYQFILDILNDDREKARKVYSNLLRKALEIKVDNFLREPRVLVILRRKLLNFFPNINTKDKSFLSDSLIENKIREFSKIKKLRSPEAKAAKQYFVKQLFSNGYTIKDIAQELGLNTRTIYNLLS
jgi:putative transposase